MAKTVKKREYVRLQCQRKGENRQIRKSNRTDRIRHRRIAPMCESWVLTKCERNAILSENSDDIAFCIYEGKRTWLACSESPLCMKEIQKL